MSAPRNPNHLKVVAKTFRLIEAMAQVKSSVHLSDLSRTLKQPKASVFRILFTLSGLGYVQQDPTAGTYHLSEKIGWFSRDEVRATIKRAARPFMERLLSRFEQTVNLGLLDRDQVLYAEILDGLRSIRMAATINTYSPLHSTALGKSILAFLEPHEAEQILKRRPLTRFTSNTVVSVSLLAKSLRLVRSRGFAVDNEETEMGARCVAAPIFDSEGRPVAAISVSGPISHVQGIRIKEISDALVEACRGVSERIGFSRSAARG